MASKAAELRDLPADELHARIDAAKEELFNLRFQLATGQLDNPARMRVVRHEVARIATVLREREIEEGLGDMSGTGPETGPEIGSEDGPEDGEDRQ
jgi:large subunit ribosomal protein L29